MSIDDEASPTCTPYPQVRDIDEQLTTRLSNGEMKIIPRSIYTRMHHDYGMSRRAVSILTFHDIDELRQSDFKKKPAVQDVIIQDPQVQDSHVHRQRVADVTTNTDVSPARLKKHENGWAI